MRTGGRPSKEDALLAVAVVNRIRRALADISDATVNRIGNVSVAFGRAFGVERWAYELFAEEVIRGGPAFAVSLVITAIEPTLRNAAALGAWQVGGGVVAVINAMGFSTEKRVSPASHALSVTATRCLCHRALAAHQSETHASMAKLIRTHFARAGDQPHRGYGRGGGGVRPGRGAGQDL